MMRYIGKIVCLHSFQQTVKVDRFVDRKLEQKKKIECLTASVFFFFFFFFFLLLFVCLFFALDKGNSCLFETYL